MRTMTLQQYVDSVSGKITIAHVQAVHDSAHDCEEEAERRAERMPTSSAVLAERAHALREVEALLLEMIPAEKRWTYAGSVAHITDPSSEAGAVSP